MLNGVVGPRGDGYVVGSAMSATEAARYHALQARAFAAAGADMVTAVTMTYVDEAIGVARAAAAVDLPAVISSPWRPRRLPSGQAFGDAIAAVDAATGGALAYFMVNCAHPTHFDSTLEAGGGWVERIGGVRANASTDEPRRARPATELDRGDPAQLAAEHQRLRALLPGLAVVGGCCGTDDEHVGAIATALVSSS